jgi:PAS domain S-box-containing protein
LLAGASFEGIVIHNNGIVFEVNDAFLQMTGYDRSDLIGKYGLGILTQESQDAVRHQVAIGSEEPYEVTIKRKDGTLFAAEIHGKNMCYKGLPARVTAARDITERKRAEEAIRTSEANYRAILDAANDAIFAHDVDTGLILEVNRTMCEMYGYTAEEAKQLSISDLSAEEPPYTQQSAFEWLSRAKDGEPQLFEWKAKHKSGRLFWVEVNLKVASIGGRNRILAVVRDISERKQAEEAKQRMEAYFKEQQRQFFRQTIQAATDGKLIVIEPEEITSLDGEMMKYCKLGGPEDITLARHRVKCAAECLGMSETRSENLTLCVGEAATNALKHAGGGFLSLMTRGSKIIVKISDHGPGMDALILPRATLELGYSTGHSLGMGYAVILALADQTYLCTGPTGTTVVIEMNVNVTPKAPVDCLPDTW